MRRALFLVTACLPLACFSDPADVPFTYTVSGTVSGMWDGASVTVRLEAPDIDEVLTVEANGAFTFAAAVPEQTDFTVTVDELPDAHTCTVAGSDSITDANVDDVTIECNGPSVEIRLSAPIEWTFDMDRLDYEIGASTLIQSTAVTVEAADATAIRLNGDALSEATPSAPSELAVGPNALTVTVEAGDAHRTYSIVIDRGAEAFGQYLYGKASNTGSNDAFGTALAMTHDALVVGAPLEDSATYLINGPEDDNSLSDAGAVYVFRWIDGVWTKEAYVKTFLGEEDEFGASVAVDADTLVVGAPGDDGPSNNEFDRGAAYVFRREAGIWSLEAQLRPSNAADIEGFGTSVAVDGDLLAVGSAGGLTSRGSVYIFRRDGSVWAEEDRIQGSEGGGVDSFGASVAIDGTRLVVGSPGNLNGFGNRVYVFEETAGDWGERNILRPLSGTATLQGFGAVVALDGDSIAVGARGDSCECSGIDPVVDNEAGLNSGAAYVFHHDGTDWQRQVFIKASNSNDIDEFGMSIALKGDLLLVGARNEAGSGTGVDADPSDNAASQAGAGYLFRRNGSTWSQEQFIKASNTDVNDWFGSSVAINDHSLVIGAIGEDSSATGFGGDDTNDDVPSSGALYGFY